MKLNEEMTQLQSVMRSIIAFLSTISDLKKAQSDWTDFLHPVAKKWWEDLYLHLDIQHQRIECRLMEILISEYWELKERITYHEETIDDYKKRLEKEPLDDFQAASYKAQIAEQEWQCESLRKSLEQIESPPGDLNLDFHGFKPNA